jgi:hypothetical protein
VDEPIAWLPTSVVNKRASLSNAQPKGSALLALVWFTFLHAVAGEYTPAGRSAGLPGVLA